MRTLAITEELINYNFQVVDADQRVSKNIRRSRKLAVNVKSGVAFINPSDISIIESLGNQATITMADGEQHVASKSLKDFEDLLDQNLFTRVHKCYIVNLDFVKKFDKEMNFIEMEDGSRADISRRKKDDFFKSFFYV